MLIGHEQLWVSFEKLIRENALGHAYLFFGDAEIGKASFARHLSARIEKGDGLSAEPLSDTAVFIPNEKGTVGIDEVRALKRFLWQTPFNSQKRVGIVDGAHALTPEAQGAMLKIVEEPPAHGLLILITYEPQAISAPLLSRLSKIYFSRMPEKALSQFLVKEKALTERRADEIAKKSHGRVGRALKLLSGAEVPMDDIAKSIEARILALREKGLAENSGKLAWLLEREAQIAQYNVNAPLQKKAVEYKG